MLQDDHRGTTYELLLAKLRYVLRGVCTLVQKVLATH
jgi:hypothetical protein